MTHLYVSQKLPVYQYMGFSKEYINRFIHSADVILRGYESQSNSDIEIGEFIECPTDPEAVIEIMDMWVSSIDKLLLLTSETSDLSYSEKYRKIYAERCMTYDEYYYLFSENISEEDYINTPAYLFTKTYSKDLRARRFKDYEFSPESYKKYILSLNAAPSKYFLSKSTAQFPVSALFAHSYCVAKTRSGKTEFLKLIIYNLIKRKDDRSSLLILDPHGEFARELRRLKILQKYIDNFVYLDPTIDSIHTPVFNPFDVVSKSTAKLAYTTDTILDAFQQLLRDQAITGNMKRLLRHVIYALLYNDGTTMMDMLTLLSAIGRNRNQKVPEFLPHEEKLMDYGRNCPDPLTQRFFEIGWKEVDSRTISAVVERIDGILSHPLVRRFVIGKTSIDLEHYLNSGKIVVVNLDFTKLGNIGSEAIGRLIVSEAQNISAQRNSIPKSIRPRTLVFMDESQRFVSAAIERALSEFAKFNTYLFLSHQYIEQIDDGMVKAMIANTENKVIGRNSASSLASISADIGVAKDDLMKIKKYQFYVKAGDRNAFLFQSSDMLLDYSGSEFYITEETAKKMVDKYMIQKFYRPVEEAEGAYIHSGYTPRENDQNTTDTSHNLRVKIDPSDF